MGARKHDDVIFGLGGVVLHTTATHTDFIPKMVDMSVAHQSFDSITRRRSERGHFDKGHV